MTSTMFRVIVVACTLTLVASQTTEVSQCINHEGELPINLYIENCAVAPCQLPQLSTINFQLVFRAPRTIREMRTFATAYLQLGPITVPYPYNLQEDSFTCNFLTNTYCPVLQDEVVKYSLGMHIESFMPVGTAVTIEFRVVDVSTTPGSQLPVICLRVPIAIVSPRQITSENKLVGGDHSTI